MAAGKPTKEELAAARKYLEHSHAAEHLSGKPAHEANRQASQVDDQWERARDIALTGTEKEFEELPTYLKSHQRRERQRAGITAQHAARIRSGYRNPPPRRSRHKPARTPPARPRPAPTRPRPAPVRIARSTAQQLAAPTVETASSWSQFAVRTAGWGLALSLFYLVLTASQKGSNPIGKLSSGLGTTVQALVSSTVDPLNHRGAPVVRAAPAAISPRPAPARTAPAPVVTPKAGN